MHIEVVKMRGLCILFDVVVKKKKTFIDRFGLRCTNGGPLWRSVVELKSHKLVQWSNSSG